MACPYCLSAGPFLNVHHFWHTTYGLLCALRLKWSKIINVSGPNGAVLATKDLISALLFYAVTSLHAHYPGCCIIIRMSIKVKTPLGQMNNWSSWQLIFLQLIVTLGLLMSYTTEYSYIFESEFYILLLLCLEWKTRDYSFLILGWW